MYYLQKEDLEGGQCLGLLYKISRIVIAIKYTFSLCIPLFVQVGQYKSYILCTLNLYIDAEVFERIKSSSVALFGVA